MGRGEFDHINVTSPVYDEPGSETICVTNKLQGAGIMRKLDFKIQMWQGRGY